MIHGKLTTGTGPWARVINIVFIQERMHRVHERSGLAYELGHVVLGHRDDRPKHEVGADRYAANNVVDPEHLVDLMRWSLDTSRWAYRMRATTRLIRVYWKLHRLNLPAA